VETKVLVKVELNPTEDESKVMEAVSNLTGSSAFKRWSQGRRTYLVQEGDEFLLTKLRSLLRRDRTLDAARRLMLRGIEGSTIIFHINKQVALAGHVTFCMPVGESPLGPITFHISTDDPKSLIEWLATRTVDGVPVDELCQSGSPRYARLERRTWS
jgi:predicted RNA binding protein with dsRBD fold (UPF0201 family)